MLKNYVKTALRSLSRNRMHAFINILGLSMGITCSLVLVLLANYASSYDDFQENKDRIHRIVFIGEGQGGEKEYTPGVPIPLPNAIREDFPEFEKVVFTRNHHGEMLFTINPEAELPNYFELNDERLAYTEPQYLDVFTTNWKAGNKKTALEKPGSIIISNSLADKFFPGENPLGKVIIFNKKTQLEVTGVTSDPPDNSDIPFDMLISLSTIKDEIKNSGWNSVSSDDQCYLLMADSDKPEKFRTRLDAFVDKYLGEEEEVSYFLQPMTDLHFNDNWSNYNYRTMSKGEIMVMIIIAIFLLLTACVNFVNLSTAVAVKRSREVGIRKVLGGTRRQLMLQFLAESLGIISLSIIVALGMAELMIMYLNPFLEVSLEIKLTDPKFLMSLAGGAVLITFLAGFYPAIVLARFKPALALKNLITHKQSGGLSLRKGLVVFQFFISQFFIIGTVITLSQMDYLRNADVGFKTDALVNIRIPEDDETKKKTLKTELNRLAGVEKVSLQFSNPSSSSTSVSNFYVEDNPEEYFAAMKFADEDYIDIYDIEILAGRNIRQSDTLREVVVNEKLLKYIGHKGTYEEAIGKQLKVWGVNIPIVGVVKDFHSQSLKEEIMTIMIFSHTDAYRMATLKANMKNFNSVNSEIRDVWKSLYPEFDYEHTFLDEAMKRFYEGDQKMTAIFTFFSAIAIVIGCLGLFGLASFMINQKVKEIGVRKVLGATVTSIVSIFSISFLKLIGIAFLLAAPAAWYVMNQWLQNFKYKVELGPIYFAAALLATLFIAVLTVGYKSVKAATANPVDSLRSE